MRHLISLLFTIGLLITSGCQEQFEGTWVHTIPWSNGQERTLILRGIRDNEGKLIFEFLKQHYSYKPSFIGYSSGKDKIEMNFKLVAYYGDHDSGHRLKYILRKEQKVLRGKLLQSWKEPVEVTLSKLNEEDAVKALEALAKELDSRKAKIGERYKTYNKAKRDSKGSIKELEVQLSKSQDEIKKLKEQLLASQGKIQQLEAKFTAAEENIIEDNMSEK